MAHEHGHIQADGPTERTRRRIAVAMSATLGFVVVETAAGFWGHSLALISDAAHNVTDVIALGITWYALRMAAEPADSSRTFGSHRVGILAALFNSTTLVVVAGYILYEAYQRLMMPSDVNSTVLIGVGTIALLLNAGTAWLIHAGSGSDLNVRSAFMHLTGDVLSTLGAIAAGVVIAFTGMNWLDSVVSVMIAVLIVWNAWGILREAINILLENTPSDIDTAKLVTRLLSVEGVNGVHDLHVWSITKGLRALSAHILTDDMAISHGRRIQQEMGEILFHEYNIGHATLQLECSGCEPVLLYCDMAQGQKVHEEHVHHSTS